ncbi:MAG: phenylalanine--tRNA ligase subunit alpha [Dehalococcoidia bacterium]
MIDQVQEIKSRALKELDAASGPEELERWRVSYLGRKGALTQVLRSLGSLPQEDRRSIGREANQVKRELEAALTQREEALKRQTLTRKLGEAIDVTLPGHRFPVGRLHPTTQVRREVCQAFAYMGFRVVEGPEVEWDYYNFEALNIPPGHPAREMFDTFWIDYVDEQGQRPMLMRTHTSPMQIRVMEKTRPPVRVVVPGRVYRYEATDATHESIFFQVEGLAVDEGITFADMKGTLYEFARLVFGPERKVRFRCDYFPFVEPGAEVAIDCFSCGGRGCRVCGNSGWVEIMGAGMVHPKVLERVDYDPSVYTGFAFGIGLERIAMLKYGIDDVRLFYGNDVRFLRQF